MTPLPLRRLCIVAMAVLTWGAPSALGQVPDRLAGRMVREVQLRSAGQVVRDAQLEGLVEIQPGQPLGMAAVRETIVHLMGMGRYIDVQVSAVEDGDAVRVEIDLVPLRDVGRIAFSGELGLPEEVLREAVTDRFGASPAYSRAADIARALEELLANHGFLRANVEPRQMAEAPAGGNLVFHVASGVRARVRTVSYRADDPADARDLQSRVPLGTGSFLDRAELRRRLDSAAERWRARRYYEARADATVEESAGGDKPCTLRRSQSR